MNCVSDLHCLREPVVQVCELFKQQNLAVLSDCVGALDDLGRDLLLEELALGMALIKLNVDQDLRNFVKNNYVSHCDEFL